MKKILIALLLLPFFAFSQIQDEYYRSIDWTFLPDSIIQLTDSTYYVFADPKNFNDPGAIDRFVGEYVVDFVGHRYIVLDSTATYLTLYDIYHTGQAPQTGQIAHCYRSVGNGEAQFIGSVDYSTLDESARWKINGADNELMWQRVENKVPYLGAKKDVDLGANSISTDTVKVDGVPLLLNTFKQGNLGDASNIFYSTGASSQPASGSVNQVIGGNLLTTNYVPKWDGNKFANSGIYELSGKFGIGTTTPESLLSLGKSDYNTNALAGFAVSQSAGGRLDFKVQTWGVNSDYGLTTGMTLVAPNYDTKDIHLGIGYSTGTEITNNKLAVNGSGYFNGNLIADVLNSTIPTGTPPLVVASSTKVDSLNAGLLDGKKASDFQLKSDTLTFDATLSDLADSSAAIRALANTKASVSGTDNYIMKKTGANTVGNSVLIENNGKIGIGFTAPIAKLHVVESTILDSIQGAYQIITSEQGNAGNAFLNNQYLYRKSDGSNWISARWHDGISVDASYNVPGATTRTWWEREPAYGIQSWGDQGVTHMTINGGNVGIGTTTPSARIHSQSTGTQVRLGYDANKYTDLSTGSTGNLTIDPTGDTVKVVGAVNSTGGFSTTAKSNLNDVIGDSAVFANMKMTYGAGLNKIIYSDATGNFIWGNQSSTLLAIAGVTPSTGYLYYNGSTFSYASGGSAQWTADTYGIKYTAGKVGIGIGSDSGNLLTVGDGSTNTKIAISASSLNQRAIFATSSSNTAIAGQGGLDGVYGVGTRYGVQGASVNGNGIRGASTNAAGISGTSAHSYGGEFSGLGVNISSGGLLINGTTRISSTGTFTPSNGASGSFTSADGKTITVTNGIITGIN